MKRTAYIVTLLLVSTAALALPRLAELELMVKSVRRHRLARPPRLSSLRRSAIGRIQTPLHSLDT